MLVAMVASLQLHFVYLGMLHLNKTSTNVDVTNVGQGLGGGGGGALMPRKPTKNPQVA